MTMAGKKLGWCERVLAISQRRKDLDVESCRKKHGVEHCGDACPDYPWPEQKPANSSTWPKG